MPRKFLQKVKRQPIGYQIVFWVVKLLILLLLILFLFRLKKFFG